MKESDDEELIEGINKIRKLGQDILIEEYIKGNEVSCGVIETINGIEALEVLDIKTNSTFYDYDAKYKDNNTYIDVSSLDKDIVDKIKKTARRVFITLNSKDYARVDMIVNDNGIYVLEINTLPGMTSHSLIPKELNIKKISYSEFLDNLIESKLSK